jgi:DNA-binding LytR/AlgR family response regulator
MFKVLIVEDYPDEADALREALERYATRHNLEFRVTWSETATALASGNRTFDLVFLDIELPGMSGMDAATLMRSYDSSTPIIFTTSLSQYAARSYEVDAAGFIVKPVTYPKLEMCMDKVIGRLRSGAEKRLVFNVAGGIRVLDANDIRYVELQRHDLIFHLGEQEPLKLRGTIREIMDRAGEDGPLIQISSGCLVNMDFIRLIKGSDIQMADGTTLALSRSRKKEVLEAFSSYLGKAF